MQIGPPTQRRVHACICMHMQVCKDKWPSVQRTNKPKLFQLIAGLLWLDLLYVLSEPSHQNDLRYTSHQARLAAHMVPMISTRLAKFPLGYEIELASLFEVQRVIRGSTVRRRVSDLNTNSIQLNTAASTCTCTRHLPCHMRAMYGISMPFPHRHVPPY